MTSRERWTIYPLLFFALVLGFKSNYRNPLQFRCNTIECRSLTVGDNLTVRRINGSNYVTQSASGVRPQLVIEGLKLPINAGKSNHEGEGAEAVEQANRSTEGATDESSDETQADTSRADNSTDAGEPPAQPDVDAADSTESTTD